jgi:glycerophosphoryl diester phosphodiesterase
MVKQGLFMKRYLLVVLSSSMFIAGHAYGQQSAEARLNAMFDTKAKTVYVAAHRGDWRNAPENSILSLQWASKEGVDIVECDLKRTKDGQLVVMHDPTLNRTTTGTGAVSDHTLEEIKHLKLRAGTAHPTAYSIPTFSEELNAARESGVVLDIDQGWDYLPDVIAQVRAAHQLNQVILNVFPNTSYADLQSRVGEIPEDAALMIVVNMARPDAENLIQSYRMHKRTIVQCIFADEHLESVQQIPGYRQHFPIWINSLWPDQNANHDDDRAVDSGQPDQTWGWIVSHGAGILQTDRPNELLQYLQHQHLR